ncbi:MAG: hypothetical protein ACXWJW_07485 [Xanthobacteraceae bacterium]
MVDLKAIADELHHARAACAEAQAAISDIESLVWEVSHPRPSRPRLMFVIDGIDPAEMHTLN